MAGQVTLRQWYVLVRRAGTLTQRIQVRINPSAESPEVDPFVGPIYRDFDTIVEGDDLDLGDEDPSVLAEVGLVSTTQNWEIQYLE